MNKFNFEKSRFVNQFHSLLTIQQSSHSLNPLQGVMAFDLQGRPSSHPCLLRFLPEARQSRMNLCRTYEENNNKVTLLITISNLIISQSRIVQILLYYILSKSKKSLSIRPSRVILL